MLESILLAHFVKRIGVLSLTNSLTFDKKRTDNINYKQEMKYIFIYISLHHLNKKGERPQQQHSSDDKTDNATVKQ